MNPVSPIVTPAFKDLVVRSCEYLTARESELREQYGLGTYERYDWDQDRGTIVFSNAGKAGLVADIYFVGSISSSTRTWLWSWANKSMSCRVSDPILEVKRYGETHHIAHLTEPYWTADEVVGWEMTSVAGYLLSAAGGYRTPDQHGFIYMLLRNVMRVT